MKETDTRFLEQLEELSVGRNELDPELFFTNRKSEFFEIEKNKFIKLYSPSGFGKTFLLNELQKKYSANNYRVFFAHFRTTEGKPEKCYGYKKINDYKELVIWLNSLKVKASLLYFYVF